MRKEDDGLPIGVVSVRGTRKVVIEVGDNGPGDWELAPYEARKLAKALNDAADDAEGISLIPQ